MGSTCPTGRFGTASRLVFHDHPRFGGKLLLQSAGRNEDPDFTVKQMIVQVSWPGATVQDTLQQVTDRIEKKLQETPNLDYLRSYTRAGQTTVFVNLLGSTPAREFQASVSGAQKIGDVTSTLPVGTVGPSSMMSSGHLWDHLWLHR